MTFSQIAEFTQLFQEFRDTFVCSPEGQEHIEFYERHRQTGQQNFAEIQTHFTAEGITIPEQVSPDLAFQVFQKLLPHTDSSNHRGQGFWIHHAPAIAGDIQSWYDANGEDHNWSAIALAVYRFIADCITAPAQLPSLCHAFARHNDTKGFQAGMLTPILNALRPEAFLLINSKSQQTIGYFSQIKCSAKLTDYPATNQQGHALIQRLAPTMADSWDSPLSPADQFDMFCHWLVALKKYSFTPLRYWKIAPGEAAWQWSECRDQGFIAIGWDDLGDISALSRTDFDIHRDQALTNHPDWKKRGLNQVWVFSKIKVGDRIVANRGTSDVLGIGTVTGPYYYQADAPELRHRLPVQWDDLTPRRVQQSGWRSTLMRLDKATFHQITAAPTGQAPSSPSPKVTESMAATPYAPITVHPDCPFNLTTFDLLAQLHANPKKTVYDQHKKDFKDHLEEPFQRLMLAVADQLPVAITEIMETRRRIFAKILKNDWGQGGAWGFYWGAFYPKGGKRTEDAQLFLGMHHEHVECGFYIGEYGSAQRQRFLKNCQVYQTELAKHLQSAIDRKDLIFGRPSPDTNVATNDEILYSQGVGFSDWLQDPSTSKIRVAASLPKVKVLETSEADLIAYISQIYEQVFPLVLLATLDEPMSLLQEYLEPAEDVSVTQLNEAYTLTQCAADTYLDASRLQEWVDAIERKGQAVLYGPPGTGKTFLAEHLARHLLSEGDGFHALVQFHPAYTYEDFIQGIRPQQGKNGELDYPLMPGRFFKFCEQARTRKDTCVLIIDEINRANLAQVFGELMYLMEYRDKEVELASGRYFSIPKNVRIIGTMNTADRSIALVDHALRRRFAFLPLYPDMSILRKYHASPDFSIDGLVQILTEVNRAIGDRQYELGTSFFLRTALSAELQAIWQLEIEPYLEEYFFDRPEQVDKFRWSIIQRQLQP